MADLNQVRRRADEFARLVDGAVPPPNPVQDPEFHHAITLVEQMREAGAVRPSAEFSASLRQRLVEEHAARITATPNLPDTDAPDVPEDDDEVATATPLHGPRHRRGRLIAGAAAFAVLAGGIGSAAAAQQSMPGDALYALKRGLESVASKVSVTDDARGRRELSHALARLTEAEQLVTDKAKTGTVNDTLGDFSDEARSGGDHLLASFRSDNDASAVEKIYVFSEEAQRRLVALAKRSPAAVRPAILAALRTVGDLVKRTLTACPTCVSPKTMTTISPESISPTQQSQNPTDPNDPTIKDPERSNTDLATPGISQQPPTLQTPSLPPTGPTSVPGSTISPLPSVPIPSLPTPHLPSLPTRLPSLPLPTVSLPFTFPTLSLPLPSLPILPPLLPKEIRLVLPLPITQSAKSSSTPSKAITTAPSKKTTGVKPSKPVAVPSVPRNLPWPWLSNLPTRLPSTWPTTLPSSWPSEWPTTRPSTPAPTATPTVTPSETPSSSPTVTPSSTPTTPTP